MASESTHNPAWAEVPVIDPQYTYGSATDHIVGIPLQRGFQRGWLAGAGLALAIVGLGLASAAFLLYWGPGVWGVDIPVAWGFAIINFVWWIGIGHAGTLISAILLLLRQDWRNSINRFAEAMTLFAVAMAGLFPLMHLGRFWKFYYLLPYPDTMGAWPQWRSPLVWDVFAVMTYFTVSLIFWYVGLIPDFGTMRATARRRWVARLAGVLSLGWRGGARHWQNHQMVYLLLAGLATPLVVSVHSIVSLDFATAILPGWHTTIFPPYFVAGAIYSGFAMVFMIALPLRRVYKLQGLITERHLDNMAKVMLVSGLVVAYGYIMDNFTAFFSSDKFEVYMAKNRAFGPYAAAYWSTLTCNVLIGQALWIRWVRTHPVPLFLVATAVNLGMWLERYTIIVVSLHRDFLPTSWGMYSPTFWDWTLLTGTLALFTLLMYLFIRLVPMISMFEVRELLHKRGYVPAAETVGQESAPATRPALPDQELYGVMGEFERVAGIVSAAQRARAAGYRRVDAYTPFPIEELPAALRLPRNWVPLLVLIGGLCGASSAYFMQYYAAVFSYPWNVGGRPLHSWPSFVPLTFELGVLGGALFGLFGMLILNRLPRPYHPVFNAPGFRRAARDRFFLCIEKRDPLFSRAETPAFMQSLGALRVSEVPAAPQEHSS
jgi:Ni/Fe-hydrogenase subunit HybB-like protein